MRFLLLKQILLQINQTTMQNKNIPSVIFLVGGPGSGKGTQSDIMVHKHKFVHYSTGDLLREFIQEDCEEARKISNILKQGKLVSSDMIVDMLKKKIFENGANNKTYLIDGFPRSAENFSIWKQIMKDDVNVKMVLNLDCTLQTLQKRLIQRGQQSGRDDDNRETILKRFKTFKDQTTPFLNYYQQNVGHIYTINGEDNVGTVTDNIESILHDQNLI